MWPSGQSRPTSVARREAAKPRAEGGCGVRHLSMIDWSWRAGVVGLHRGYIAICAEDNAPRIFDLKLGGSRGVTDPLLAILGGLMPVLGTMDLHSFAPKKCWNLFFLLPTLLVF